VRVLRLGVFEARCMLCNGRLMPVTREEVSGEVPARSLVWAREFFRCQGCGRVFWRGTHWQRIECVRQRLAALTYPSGGCLS